MSNLAQDLEAALKRIAALEDEIRLLKAQGGNVHYHYYPNPNLQPVYYPPLPYLPYTHYPYTTC